MSERRTGINEPANIQYPSRVAADTRHFHSRELDPVSCNDNLFLIFALQAIIRALQSRLDNPFQLGRRIRLKVYSNHAC